MANRAQIPKEGVFYSQVLYETAGLAVQYRHKGWEAFKEEWFRIMTPKYAGRVYDFNGKHISFGLTRTWEVMHKAQQQGSSLLQFAASALTVALEFDAQPSGFLFVNIDIN